MRGSAPRLAHWTLSLRSASTTPMSASGIGSDGVLDRAHLRMRAGHRKRAAPFVGLPTKKSERERRCAETLHVFGPTEPRPRLRTLLTSRLTSMWSPLPCGCTVVRATCSVDTGGSLRPESRPLPPKTRVSITSGDVAAGCLVRRAATRRFPPPGQRPGTSSGEHQWPRLSRPRRE